MGNYQALELVQANYQTYIVFTDNETGDLKASFQYQKEIKSGFVYLCDQSDEEDPEDVQNEEIIPEYNIQQEKSELHYEKLIDHTST